MFNVYLRFSISKLPVAVCETRREAITWAENQEPEDPNKSWSELYIIEEYPAKEFSRSWLDSKPKRKRKPKPKETSN